MKCVMGFRLVSASADNSMVSFMMSAPSVSIWAERLIWIFKESEGVALVLAIISLRAMRVKIRRMRIRGVLFGVFRFKFCTSVWGLLVLVFSSVIKLFACVCVCNGFRPLYLGPNIFCVGVVVDGWVVVLIRTFMVRGRSLVWLLDSCLFGFSCLYFSDLFEIWVLGYDELGFVGGAVAAVMESVYGICSSYFRLRMLACFESSLFSSAMFSPDSAISLKRFSAMSLPAFLWAKA